MSWGARLPLNDPDEEYGDEGRAAKGDRMTDVWLVIRDDGNSQGAEESVDSVWTSRQAAHSRARSLVTPYSTRVEIHTLDCYEVAGATT